MADLRSPLADLDLPTFVQNWQGVAALTIKTRKPASLVQVQAWPDTIQSAAECISAVMGALPSFEPGRVTVGENGASGVVGPGRILIEFDKPDATERAIQSVSSAHGTVTDLGHARLIFELSGDKAAFTLSKGINVDFDMAAFPVGTIMATGIHGMPLTIVRSAPEIFRVFAPTTFAGAFAEWLSEAARDIGYRMVT